MSAKSAQVSHEVARLEALLDGEAAERRALESALRERERHSETLLSSAPLGLAIVDNSMRYVRISEESARANGRPAAEHVGLPVSEVVPDVAPAVEAVIRRSLETREPVLNLEVTGEAPGDPGREHTWLLSSIPLAGAGDAPPQGVCALVYDVTDWREAERERAESEARYRMLVEHSSDAVLVFDEEGSFLEVNPRLCGLLGYERGELLGMNVRDLLPAEELARLPVNYAELRAGKTVRRERRLLRKDGTQVRVEVVGSMVGEGRMQSVVRELSPEEPEAAALPRDRVSLLKDVAAALTTAAEFLEGGAGVPDLSEGIEFYEEVSRFESDLISRALSQTYGNQKKAAELLGVNHTTLHTMMRRYRIDPAVFKPQQLAFPRLVRESRPRRK